MSGLRSRGRGDEGGFTLVEMLVTVAITGVFILMVAGLLVSSTGLARKQQARSSGRSAARFAMVILATNIAEAGGRILPTAAFSVADTLNNTTDPNVADPGSDTFSIMRSRSGSLTSISDTTGGATVGTMQVVFHTDDDTGPNAICPDAPTCIAAFAAEFGGDGDLLLVMSGTSYWVLRISAPPTVNLGAGGSINLSYAGVKDNTGGANFSVANVVTGLEVRTFRVKDEALEMKTDFFAGPGNFELLAARIEDLQVAYILNDGTYVNNGIPAQVENIRAAALTLVGISPLDLTIGGTPFFRPAVEDHTAGTARDKRRRSVWREIVWGRNLG